MRNLINIVVIGILIASATLVDGVKTKQEKALEEFHEMMQKLTPEQRWKIHWLGRHDKRRF